MTKTTAEKIAVMQAYESGEKIEAFVKGVWKQEGSPAWMW